MYAYFLRIIDRLYQRTGMQHNKVCELYEQAGCFST